MNKENSWKQARWMVAVSLISGLAGAAFTLAHVRAAPVEVPAEKNTTDEPIIHSANYVPETMAVFTLHSEPGRDDSEPILILTSQVKVGMILPGRNTPTEIKFFGHMYISGNDLEEFPSAMLIAKRDDGTVCTPIDSTNEVLGLKQINYAFATAHGLPLEQ